MRFDELILHLGEFGAYQKKIYYLLCYPMFVCAFQKLMWVFVAADLPHRCQLPEDEDSNLTNSYYLPDAILNMSIPWDSNLQKWDSCNMYSYNGVNETWIIKCNRWVYDHSQYTTSVVSDFDIVCDNKWLSALSVSLQMGGEFLGGIILGILSDKYGRRIILVISGIMLTTFGIITSLANSEIMLIACRVLIGFWTPGVVLTAYVIGMEFVGPSKRVFAGIVTQYFFALGYLLIAVTAFFVREWRYLQVALSVPSILIISYWWLVPESVRWMLTQNKKDQALETIKKIAEENQKQLPEDFFNNEIHLGEESSGSLKDLMYYPNLRKRTLVVVYCWFVNSCVYYGFSLNTSNLAGSDYVNFGLAAAVEFPAYTVCLLTLDRFGRRLPLCIAMVVGGISLFVTTFVPSESTLIIVVLAMFGKFAITVSYAIIYMFSAEVFPTTVRSASYGFSSTCGRIGAMLAPFMLLLNKFWLPLPSVLFSILALTSGLCCLMLPETGGRELPETILDGENFTKPKSRITLENVTMVPLAKTFKRDYSEENSSNGHIMKSFGEEESVS